MDPDFAPANMSEVLAREPQIQLGAAKVPLVIVIFLCCALGYSAYHYGGLKNKYEHRGQHNCSGQKVSPRQDLKSVYAAFRNFNVGVRASKPEAASLQKLWRLRNPFVSDSTELQLAYRRSLLKYFAKLDDESWSTTAAAVGEAIKPFLHREEQKEGNAAVDIVANIRDVTRCATLAAVSKSLFDIDGVPTDTLHYVGAEIHRHIAVKKVFDIGSPDPSRMPKDLLRSASRLIDTLQDMFSKSLERNELCKTILASVSGTPEDVNPLNLLGPAFEVPWRGVFYMVLSVLQKDLALGRKDVETLINCPAHKPPSAQALAIAYETFRLYPPVRRIRIGTQIDIEAIHRDPSYWGATSAEWDPSRFLNADGAVNTSLVGQDSAWLPFAAGSMKCPSASSYAMRLMTVTAGEVLRQLFPGGVGGRGDRWSLRGPEWGDEERRGELLRAGRDEYTSVSVVVKG